MSTRRRPAPRRASAPRHGRGGRGRSRDLPRPHPRNRRRPPFTLDPGGPPPTPRPDAGSVGSSRLRDAGGPLSEAGELARAGELFAKAAERAAEALAFDCAVTLYRRVLELRSPGQGVDRGLRIQLADALADAGRTAEAR